MGMHEETWYTYAIQCEQCEYLGPSVVNNQRDAEEWALKFGFLRLPYSRSGDTILYHWFCPTCRINLNHLETTNTYDGRYWHYFLADM